MACFLVTLVRNVQGYTMASPWYIFEVMYCTNNMFTVLFMYQQDVYGVASRCPLVVYDLVIYLITKIYLSTKIYFIGGWGGRGLTCTLCICIVLL